MLDNTETVDLSHYPADWNEFIGQADAVRRLKVAARSSKARKATMGHVLISSPVPGIGKTSLALLTSMELGGSIRLHSGPIKIHQLPFLFMDMKPGDVLFLDEAHRLVEGGKKNAEWLLHALQDGMYPTPLGMEPMPDITIIAATTDAGRLPQPILDRFEITPELAPYGDEDGAQITGILAQKILVKDGLTAPTAEVCAAIARAGNNSPRHIKRILCALRDLVWADEIKDEDGVYDLTEAFSFAGVTADGLTVQAQRYLMLLVTDFRGNPAGAKVLGDRLGEVGTGLVELERTLLDKGLIAFTRSGRTITPDGVRRARDLIADTKGVA